eukprot:jgi/Phyca11/563177/estExt2_Genewise1.C_PHYCAscaffold_110322
MGQLDILSLLLEKDSGHTQEQYDANDERNSVTWGGRDMQLAVKNGHSEVVHWLLEHTSNVDRLQGGVLTQAVVSGNLPILQVLVASGFRVPESHHFLVFAACEGHLELLQWLVEQNFLGENRHVPLSSNHLDVNKWLVEAGLGSEAEETFAEACGHGRLEVVKWLIDRGLGKGATWAIHVAATGGHLEVAKYLHAQGFIGCSPDTLSSAAKNGHLPVVQWLWTQFQDDPKADLLCVHGIDRFVSYAPPLTNEMADAAINGHLEVIQYLHSIALTLAGKKRKRGGSSCHTSEIEMDVVVTEAARKGHLDVVQWVCTNTAVNSTSDAMLTAAGGGHFAVVKWLHENHPHDDDFRTEVIDEAARSGNVSMLKWLHTNLPDEGWSTIAIDNAARGGHLNVLRWLYDHDFLYEDHDSYMTTSAMKLALEGNHFDALLFVHYEFKDWSNDPRLNGDEVYNEHMEAWLQEELGGSSE